MQYLFTGEFRLAYEIGKIGEKLIEESPTRHVLRSQLCLELDGSLKMMMEPVQSVIALFPDRCNSAMLAGDIDSAMQCRLVFGIGNFFNGSKLEFVSNHLKMLIKEAVSLILS